MSGSPRRAAPLSAEARRASIIAATLPLLKTYGLTVTTAQIALAAGIAEGTIFRAFPDKESLIAAAVATAFETAPARAALAAIPAGLLRDTLITAVEILQRRIEGVWQLMSMMRMATPPGVDPKSIMSRPPPGADGGITDALAALLEPHRDELRCEPAQGARVLRMMAFAASHPRIADGPSLTAAEIVAVVLDGIRTRPDTDTDTGDLEDPC